MDIILEMMARKDLTFDILRSRLLEREQQLERNEQESDRKSLGKSCTMTEHSRGRKPSSSTTFTSNRYQCGETGHMAKDCPKKKRSGKSGYGRSGGRSGRDGRGQGGGGKGKEKVKDAVNLGEHVFCLTVSTNSAKAHQKCSASELVWDSGATRSMSWDKRDFSDLKPANFGSVEIPGGDKLSVAAVGTQLSPCPQTPCQSCGPLVFC
ncbi:hypothetical protein M427DRAFT_62640 [Gonapodya prolifera JEL478]|uniref:CCHC-type domain-containing protein n=1 Tax=Gonapodya prolifera (strain JEL478) TaxID=1344416 RepID=A0A139A0D5_GONPJ|nr:hypothetical protein M427DRAFT_62640 [Gonapodya prolifera JEL478]|eukprot:KXS10230.1 hypothetical protein M427DRAFT_62640 [Gonapodya prolifera JEL478]